MKNVFFVFACLLALPAFGGSYRLCEVGKICASKNIAIVRVTNAKLFEVNAKVAIRCGANYQAKLLTSIKGSFDSSYIFSSPVGLEIGRDYLISFNGNSSAKNYFESINEDVTYVVDDTEVSLSSCSEGMRGQFLEWGEIYEISYITPDTSKGGPWIKYYVLDGIEKLEGVDYVGPFKDEGGLPYVFIALRILNMKLSSKLGADE